MQEGELIQETEWSRFYRQGGTFVMESKMRVDGFKVSASEIRRRWPGMTLAEQVDFAGAFIEDSPTTPDDQEILEYLLEAGNEPVWCMIAWRLPEYRNREQAVTFLLQHAASDERSVSNYYQALAQIGDPRAIPLLWKRYQQYLGTLSPLAERTHKELSNYMCCCSALLRLEGSEECRQALSRLLSHPEEDVQHVAQYMLDVAGS